MIKVVTTIILIVGILQIFAQETNFQKNLNLASEIFLSKSELPDSILIKLSPQNYEEFRLLYGTTHPDSKLKNTGFFYTVTQLIFDKVILEKKEIFYLPCLQLASFADGEFGESFVDNLKVIINLDKVKFCTSIKGKDYANHNPIKYFAEQYNCN